MSGGGGDSGSNKVPPSPAASPPTDKDYRSDSRGGDSEPEKRKRRVAKSSKRADAMLDVPEDEALFGSRAPSIPDRPKERYNDLGGIDAVLRDVMEQIECPISHPELYAHIGVHCPRGVLLHGPSGCGKTLLAHAIGGELGVYFRAVSGPEIVSGMSGESEKKLRGMFEEAQANAPAILFIDEIDSIAGKRSASQRGMDKRIVSQLLSCIDSLTLDASDGQAVLVIGACNHPDDLDASLRRPGRFDREICLGVPDDKARVAILRVLTRRMRLSPGFDHEALARLTPGYVGADLAALAKEAAVISVNRVFLALFAAAAAAPTADVEPVVPSVAGEPEAMSDDATPAVASSLTALPTTAPTASESLSFWIRNSAPLSEDQLNDLVVSFADFVAATKKVQPSAMREGFATIPDVSWSDVGALQDVRTELQLGIVDAIRRPDM